MHNSINILKISELYTLKGELYGMWIISQIRIYFFKHKKRKKNSTQTMINQHHKRKLIAGNKEILYKWLLPQKSKNSTHFKT